MEDNMKIKARKDEWLGKPVEQSTEQDKAENANYQNNCCPIRFFFGKETTEEDIDSFLDNILEDKLNVFCPSLLNHLENVWIG